MGLMPPLRRDPRDPRVSEEKLDVDCFYNEYDTVGFSISNESRRRPKADPRQYKVPQDGQRDSIL